MSGRVFDDLNFTCLNAEETKRSLYLGLATALEDEGIIEILTKD